MSPGSDKHISNIPAVSCKDWPQNNETLENCEFNSETRMDLTCHLYKHTHKWENQHLDTTKLQFWNSFFSLVNLICYWNMFMEMLYFLNAVSSNLYVLNCSHHSAALESREHTYGWGHTTETGNRNATAIWELLSAWVEHMLLNGTAQLHSVTCVQRPRHSSSG
jgi:hypothetical protein